MAATAESPGAETVDEHAVPGSRKESDGNACGSGKVEEGCGAQRVAERGHFATREYWDAEYAADGADDTAAAVKTFEWLQPSKDVVRFVRAFCDAGSKVLHIGCVLGEELWDAGVRRVTNVDFSTVVIDNMKRRQAASGVPRRMLQYQVMDCTAMPLQDGAVDVVVDKGTLDALVHPPPLPRAVNCCITRAMLAGNGQATSSGGAEDDATAVTLLAEVARVLKPGGVYVCVSFGVPGVRLPLFDSSVWCRSHHCGMLKPGFSDQGEASFHWVYALQRAGSGGKARAFWDTGIAELQRLFPREAVKPTVLMLEDGE